MRSHSGGWSQVILGFVFDDGHQKSFDQGVATHNQSQFFFLSFFVHPDFSCQQQIDMQPISRWPSQKHEIRRLILLVTFTSLLMHFRCPEFTLVSPLPSISPFLHQLTGTWNLPGQSLLNFPLAGSSGMLYSANNLELSIAQDALKCQEHYS